MWKSSAHGESALSSESGNDERREQAREFHGRGIASDACCMAYGNILMASSHFQFFDIQAILIHFSRIEISTWSDGMSCVMIL